MDNLGAYDSEDNIGWRALNWALNPAVEGKTGKMIFENVKDNIKNLVTLIKRHLKWKMVIISIKIVIKNGLIVLTKM